MVGQEKTCVLYIYITYTTKCNGSKCNSWSCTPISHLYWYFSPLTQNDVSVGPRNVVNSTAICFGRRQWCLSRRRRWPGRLWTENWGKFHNIGHEDIQMEFLTELFYFFHFSLKSDGNVMFFFISSEFCFVLCQGRLHEHLLELGRVPKDETFTSGWRMNDWKDGCVMKWMISPDYNSWHNWHNSCPPDYNDYFVMKSMKGSGGNTGMFEHVGLPTRN